MHSRTSEHRSHTSRGARLIATLVCIGALTGCAGSRESEPPPATAATEPEPATREAPPPADPETLKEDHRAIDRAAERSERLADKTASETQNARDRAASPAGMPKKKSAPSQDDDTAGPRRSADDTARNERDQDDATRTPTDQSNEMSDIDITAKIRRAIIGEDGLSFTARNVKIITEDGRVTLRGPVTSAEEKSRVEQAARRAAGSARVVSELEVEE